ATVRAAFSGFRAASPLPVGETRSAGGIKAMMAPTHSRISALSPSSVGHTLRSPLRLPYEPPSAAFARLRRYRWTTHTTSLENLGLVPFLRQPHFAIAGTALGQQHVDRRVRAVLGFQDELH